VIVFVRNLPTRDKKIGAFAETKILNPLVALNKAQIIRVKKNPPSVYDPFLKKKGHQSFNEPRTKMAKRVSSKSERKENLFPDLCKKGRMVKRKKRDWKNGGKQQQLDPKGTQNG